MPPADAAGTSRRGQVDLRVQWHSPDQVWAAVFMRDGQEWYLDGKLVGMDASGTVGGSVEDLIEQAAYLIEEGENFLGDVTLEDRVWLFSVLDGTLDPTLNQRLYRVLRDAGATGPLWGS